jgi:SAM-dependent methyltransferase
MRPAGRAQRRAWYYALLEFNDGDPGVHYGWYLLDDARRKLILSNLTEDVLPFGPFNVEFQPAQGLDAADQAGAGVGGLMDYDRFAELVDELVATGLASACFSGEPLAHPRIADMLYYLADRGVTVTEVRTGGAGLTDEIIRALLVTAVHTVLLDLGEIDAARQAQMTGVPAGTLPQILDGFRRLADARYGHGHHLPKLVCRFVLGTGNLEHAGLMAEVSRELQCSHVVFDVAGDLQSAGPGRLLAGELARARSELVRLRAEALSGSACGSAFSYQARTAGLAAAGDQSQSVVFPPLVYRGESDVSDSGLYWSDRRHRALPWSHALIDARYGVWPSRHLLGGSGKFGSVSDEPFATTWNGEAFRACRRAARSASPAHAGIGSVHEADEGCAFHTDRAGNDFFQAAEARLARREGVPTPPWPEDPGGQGFDAPPMRAIRTLYPRARFAPGETATVDRIHAEAEMARVESLRLRALAAELAARANRLLCAPDRLSEAGSARVESRRVRRLAGELASYSERLIAEARIAGGPDAVAAAPAAFESMRTWHATLAAHDPAVSPTVDENYVIWLSLFDTLAGHADMSHIHRALGVGVGYDGPEQYYNRFFAEHYCLDLVDYSDLNPDLKFVVANIEKGVDFPDGHFDLIYSHSAFEHLKDPARAIEEIDRLVGVGKYIYLTVQPLYYSPTGSHINTPKKLTRWEHLYPGSEYYLLDSPHAERIDEGFYLNKMTISDLLAAVGRVGWEVRHFGIELVHPREVPGELTDRYPLVDLVVDEFRLVARKVIPTSRRDW